MNRLLFLITLLLLTSCALPLPGGVPQAIQPTSLGVPAAARTATAVSDDPLSDEVEQRLAAMTLEQKVGQLMVVAFREDSISPSISEMVRERHVGGVILFTRNLQNPAHARELTDALQQLARANGAGTPLFTMLDQEGGIVVRAATGVTTWPSQMLLGATGDEALVAQAATMTARELRAIGMNMNLAPVLDVNNNPDNPVIGTRSFGSDPALVSRLGAAVIRAYQGAGVVAVAKHFPGHGDTNIDSHMSLPMIDKTPADLDRIELVPFSAAVRAGVDVIMTAHIAVPRITGNQPGTLSEAMLETILRRHLGYEGLIITDDLEMGAIVDQYGTADAALRAFRAGADLLLFRFTTDEQRRGYDLLLNAVKSEPALQQRLDQSVRRILRVKLRRGLFDPTPAPPVETVGAHEHIIAAIETAGAGLTLVRNEGKLLPLDPNAPGELLVLSPDPAELANVEVPIAEDTRLGDAVAAKHPAAIRTFPLDPDPGARSALVDAAASASAVIVGSYNAQLYPGQVALVNELLATGKPVIVVGLRLPYELQSFPDVPVYLAAYDNRPVTHTAIADAIFGIRTPRGHLPVPIGSKWPLGFRLRDYTTAEQIDTGNGR